MSSLEVNAPKSEATNQDTQPEAKQNADDSEAPVSTTDIQSTETKTEKETSSLEESAANPEDKNSSST